MAVIAAVTGAPACDPAPGEPSAAGLPQVSSVTPAPTGPSSGSAAASAASSAGGARALKQVTLEDKAMGTQVVITAYTSPDVPEDALKPKLQKAFDEVRRLEALMTTWREDSEVSRINAAAGKASVALGPETFAVIGKSLWIARESDGVFDITFEAMKGLWKFDEDKLDRIPDKAAVDAARKLIDWRKIEVDAAARSVRLGAKQRINLGGIAKGYAVDAAARVLLAEGLKGFFIRAGGDLYVRGRKPDGHPFRVGVRDPRHANPNEFFAMIEVEDHAFSTAGDYERFFIEGGKRYHHIIDPRTGWPATASRSVTIWAKDAFTADAIDDAVFILGPERGLALVESIDDCGAVIVDAHNKVWMSKRIQDKVFQTHPPTDGI
ncbi:MAG: FAD:protein FMN transferase [Polyangiaceae bacterium]